MTQASNPEIGQRVRTGAFFSNVHDQGSGPPVLLLHGSGAGVSAWANWRLLLPVLSKGRRVAAPDLFGFGYTDRPADAGNNAHYRMEAWVQQAVDLLDALGIAQADVVGNSFGGALALAAGPERIEAGWWDGGDVRRDYFIAIDGAGRRLWIFRDPRPPGGWFLQGMFA